MAHHHRQAERQSPWTSCFDLVVFLPSLVQRGLPSTIFIVFLSSEVSTECAGPVLKVNILIIILTMDLDDLLLPSVLLKQGLSRVLWPGPGFTEILNFSLNPQPLGRLQPSAEGIF